MLYITSQPRSIRVHVAIYQYNSMLLNMLISAFIPKVCAVTGGGRSGGVAGGGKDDVSGGT